jgi:sn-glycerol 3-phosphate transport system ATP-binding protein
MRLELQKLSRSLGVTSLYVTHDQVEAMTLAHRMLVMNAGRVEQIGTPLDVYRRPATTFVAGFIGLPPMNLLRGRLADGAFVAGGASLRLPGRASRPGSGGGDVVLGLRAEQLVPCAAAKAALVLDVENVEQLGADTLAHGRHGGDMIVVRLPGDERPDAGSRLPLALDDSDLHWFDAKTGMRVDA